MGPGVFLGKLEVFLVFTKAQNKTSDPMPQILETPLVGPGVFCFFGNFEVFSQKIKNQSLRPHAPDPGDTPRGAWSFFLESSRFFLFFLTRLLDACRSLDKFASGVRHIIDVIWQLNADAELIC